MPASRRLGRRLLLALSLGLLAAAAVCACGVAGVAAAWAPAGALALAATPTPFAPLPRVADFISQVQAAEVYSMEAELSGQAPALIGGVPYTLTTRHTASGAPIQQASRYVAERLQAAGLTAVAFHWTSGSYSGDDVAGLITGTTRPNEIVLMTAHLDDMPSAGRAPGADDNASGATALLVAARVLAGQNFARTVRLVFFTGEEQGLLGSQRYAQAAHAAGENIVAVYNVDMIGWNQAGGPVAQVHTRPAGNPGQPADLALAGVFTNVVAAYGLGQRLTPVIVADGNLQSDHASFWAQSYPGLLAIEDITDDRNPYYHTVNDSLDKLNLDYFTAYVQASIATVAHLAEPQTQLTGRATAAVSGDPLAGVTVQASSAAASGAYSTSTAASGVYTLAVLPAAYDLRAWKPGYTLVTLSAVPVYSDTTVDVSLAPALPYTLTGCLRDAATGAALSATVSVQGPLGVPLGDAPAPLPAGCYTLPLWAGAYTLTAQAPLHWPLTAPVTLAADLRQDFALTATTLSGRVYGQVTGPGLIPLPGLVVQAAPGLATTQSDSGGGYTLDLPPGPYTLTVVGWPFYAPASATVIVPQSNVLRQDFALVPGRVVYLPVVLR